MKNKIILLLLTVFALTVNIYSQRYLITSEQFYSATSKAEENARVFPKRNIVTEENYVDGKLVKKSQFLWEAVSNDETRTVKTIETPGNSFKQENIEIGDVLYRKENDGKWQKLEPRFEHGLTRQITEFICCTEYLVESAVLNGQNVQIYEVFQIIEENKRLGYEKRDYWVNSDGKLMKEETTYGLLNPQTVIWHKVFIHEYDAEIKIERPILEDGEKVIRENSEKSPNNL